MPEQVDATDISQPVAGGEPVDLGRRDREDPALLEPRLDGRTRFAEEALRAEEGDLAQIVVDAVVETLLQPAAIEEERFTAVADLQRPEVERGAVRRWSWRCISGGRETWPVAPAAKSR